MPALKPKLCLLLSLVACPLAFLAAAGERAASAAESPRKQTTLVAELDERDTAMAAYIDTQIPQALRLLQELVDINSGTMNFAGVRKVGDVLGQQLEAEGLETEWIDGSHWERAGHLLARSGDSGPHFLLIGHLDTVFEPDSPFQKYEPIDTHHVRGPGTTDMKGGNVVMLLVLRALRHAGLLQQCRVTVVLTGDEEKAGQPISLSRQHLIEAAAQADIAIGFEDGDGDPSTAVIARRGSSEWRLQVSATTAHSSQIFRSDIGAGAIFECARILRCFEDSLRGDPTLTFNPGVLVGGTQVDLDEAQNRGTAFGKSNVIAASVDVIGDLRSLSVPQREQAKAVMRRIVANGAPHIQATIHFDDRYPPMAPTDGNRQLLAIIDAASRILGLGAVAAVDPARAGAADIAFAADGVDMALDGLGLMGSGGHTVDEVADLRTLAVQAKRVAVAMARIIRAAR